MGITNVDALILSVFPQLSLLVMLMSWKCMMNSSSFCASLVFRFGVVPGTKVAHRALLSSEVGVPNC